MSDEELQYWTAWWAIDGIGWVTFQRLVRIRDQLQLSWGELWRLSWKQPEEVGLSMAQGEAIQTFNQSYTPVSYQEFLACQEIKVVLRNSKTYPQLLLQIADPPPVLFYKGRPELLNMPMIGVVGTRHVTQYGELVTKKITRELVADGWSIVSGFMYGVDVIAHQTAAAKGSTIGVLGFGFDHLFPHSHQPLFDELLTQGHCFVTEYAPHVQAKAGLFPRRNRLIAGMSQGVIVTEAADQSGSLITAEYAVEYGRSVYAVPGPITSPFSNGTRALLNLGAVCICAGKEITEDQQLQGQSLPTIQQVSAAAHRILKLLQQKKTTSSELEKQLNWPLSIVLSELTQLEIQGKICRVGEQWQVNK